MATHLLLMNWNNQHHQNGNTSKALNLYRFNAVPLRIPMTIFKVHQALLKFICNDKPPHE